MESIIDWVQTTGLNGWVIGNRWVWPTLETIHFFGLSLLMGALLVIDLRMMGKFKGIAISATHKLLPIVFLGFAMNLITGILFLFGDPGRYASNWGFQLKMFLVLLAGLNALLYYWKVTPIIAGMGPHDDPPALAKTIGAASLLLWFGVLIFGRLIPYVGTG